MIKFSEVFLKFALNRSQTRGVNNDLLSSIFCW